MLHLGHEQALGQTRRNCRAEQPRPRDGPFGRGEPGDLGLGDGAEAVERALDVAQRDRALPRRLPGAEERLQDAVHEHPAPPRGERAFLLPVRLQPQDVLREVLERALQVAVERADRVRPARGRAGLARHGEAGGGGRGFRAGGRIAGGAGGGIGAGDTRSASLPPCPPPGRAGRPGTEGGPRGDLRTAGARRSRAAAGSRTATGRRRGDLRTAGARHGDRGAHPRRSAPATATEEPTSGRSVPAAVTWAPDGSAAAGTRARPASGTRSSQTERATTASSSSAKADRATRERARPSRSRKPARAAASRARSPGQPRPASRGAG